MMGIKVLDYRIAVEEIKDTDAKTPSGIIVPEFAKYSQKAGRVVAVGSGKLLSNGKREPMDVRVGDIVIYDKYSGVEVEHDGTTYTILGGAEVLAVIKGTGGEHE